MTNVEKSDFEIIERREMIKVRNRNKAKKEIKENVHHIEK